MTFLSTSTSLPPASVVTLYHGSSLSLAFNSMAREVLALARPEVVQLHTAPNGIKAHFVTMAAKVRAELPGVRLWMGVGVDGWARNVADGSMTVTQVVEKFMESARIASDNGVELVKWNGEEAYKNARVKRSGLARAIVDTCKDRFPWTVQGFTSYDHPTYHAIDWKGFVGPGSPVAMAFAQVYAGGTVDLVKPHRVALPARKASALKSWATAVGRGEIEADVVPDVDAQDLDWMPYQQSHGVAASDAINLACAYSHVAWWALPTRTDKNGRDAIIGSCRLRQLGYTGATAVADFQRATGLKVDGIAGPITLGALAVATNGA